MQSINTLLNPVVNFGKVTVSTGYNITDTSIVLNTGHGSRLPNPSIDGSFNLVWFNKSTYGSASDDPNVEIVRCIARVGDTLTLMRAQEETSASNKNTPASTYMMILTTTKKTITDIKTEYESGVSTHAEVTTSVHGFDSSGNAPAQTHGISRHSGNIGSESNITFSTTVGHAHTGTDSTKVDYTNLTSVGSNTHDQIDTAVTASAGHIAAAAPHSGHETPTGAQSKVDTHSALDTGIHGVGISTVESVSGSTSKVSTHATLTATHGATGAVVGTTNSQALTNKTITDSTNNVMAKSLKSSTTTIDVSAATAPTTGQVLTATGSTTAIWQSVNVPVGSLPAQLLSSYWHATWANMTIVQGTWAQVAWGFSDYDAALTGVTNSIYNTAYTNLDEIHFGNVSLLAGKYKIQMSHYYWSNGGIIEILCGTTSLGTINTYSTGNGFTVTEITVTLSTQVSGNLRVRANGTSGSGYFIVFSRIEIIRTQLANVPSIDASNRMAYIQQPNSIYLNNAGTSIFFASDATVAVWNLSSYTKLKEIRLNIIPDTSLKIQFTLANNYYNGRTVTARIYRNGVAVGTERITGAPATYTETISGWSNGDLLQIYGYCSGYYADRIDVWNLRILCTFSPPNLEITL